MSDNFESKLSEFRSKKLKSKSSSNGPLNVFTIWHSIRRRSERKAPDDVTSDQMSDNREQRVELLSNESRSESQESLQSLPQSESTIDEEELEANLFDCKPYDLLLLSLKVLIYITCQTIAYLVQFGAVFFAISVLVFICTNLSTKSKTKGQLSAYSVFNPNCQPIHGTVSAKDLENQLTFGAIHHY